jgi:hypothetical protein
MAAVGWLNIVFFWVSSGFAVSRQTSDRWVGATIISFLLAVFLLLFSFYDGFIATVADRPTTRRNAWIGMGMAILPILLIALIVILSIAYRR